MSDEQVIDLPPVPELIETEPVKGEPLLEGPVGPIPQGDDVPLIEMRLSTAETLAELSEEFVFFTHSLLFTYANWSVDPLDDHVASVNGHCRVMLLKAPLPFFKFNTPQNLIPGVDIPEEEKGAWNYRIYVVAKTEWEPLFKFLSSLSGFNREARIFHRVVFQKLPVVDAFATSRLSTLPTGGLPTVECHCLSVLSNRWSAYYGNHHRKHPWEPIPVVKLMPDPAVVRYANQLFRLNNVRANTTPEDIIMAGL